MNIVIHVFWCICGRVFLGTCLGVELHMSSAIILGNVKLFSKVIILMYTTSSAYILVPPINTKYCQNWQILQTWQMWNVIVNIIHLFMLLATCTVSLWNACSGFLYNRSYVFFLLIYFSSLYILGTTVFGPLEDITNDFSQE